MEILLYYVHESRYKERLSAAMLLDLKYGQSNHLSGE